MSSRKALIIEPFLGCWLLCFMPNVMFVQSDQIESEAQHHYFVFLGVGYYAACCCHNFDINFC